MTTTKNHSEIFIEAFNKVVDAFMEAGNNPLSFHKNEFLVSQTAALIAKRSVEGQPIDSIKAILTKFDFRLVADYLNLGQADSMQKQRFDKILNGDTAAYYEYQIAKFLAHASSLVPSTRDAPNIVTQLDEIFINDAQSRYSLYFYDNAGTPIISSLLSDIGNRISEFLDFQPELPSLSPRAREGLVKSFTFPNGKTVISKRNNPKKEGRFEREQKNIQMLIAKLGLFEEEAVAEIGADSCGKGISIKLVRPFMIVADSQVSAYYSLSNFSPHLTLEQVMLRERDAERRQTHLSNCRKLLDYLYDKGIVWSDMAPRNILVEQSETSTIYHILDFEKTDMRPESIPIKDRIEHCRGLMSIEEFGAVCSRDEVEACFIGYFDASNESLQSISPYLLRNPVREVVNILKGRNKTQFTIEEYKLAEQEINGIRFPYIDKIGERRFPIQVSFKIDYYYGAEYDRRTTEVLLAAKRFGYLEDTQNWLESVLSDQDSQKLFSIFFDAPHIRHRDLIDKLIKKTLDSLYDARLDQRLFGQTIEKLNIDCEFFKIRENAILHPFSGRDLALKNTALIATSVSNLQEAITEKFSKQDYLVFVGGSCARGEFTAGSDLDIGIVTKHAPLGKEIEQFISSYAAERIPASIEFFPPLQIDILDTFLNANPGYFAEFTWAKVIGGDEVLIERFNSIKETRLADQSFRERAQAFYEALPNGIDVLSPKALLKQLKWSRVLPSRGSDNTTQLLNHQLDVALFLKNEDEHAKLGFASGFLPVSYFMTTPFLDNNHPSPETPNSTMRDVTNNLKNRAIDPC